MARPLRIEYEGAVYHVTSRGNERKHIFRNDEDREIFLNTLEKVNKRFNWLCHAYCLMDNHYHLIIETPDGNLSKGMRQLNGVYTQMFNMRHKGAGHIFQGRYKAILIQKETHLLEVCRYVVLNPVRSKTAEKPEAWQWSSYKATVGSDKTHPYLTKDWILGQFSNKRRHAEEKYKEFVYAGINKESIWKEVKGQSILGEEDFTENLVKYVKGYSDIKEIPKKQRYVNRPKLGRLFEQNIKQSREMLKKKATEAVEKYGYSQKEIADYLELHYSTVSRLISR
jgi:REP element-mobilizing transposase RayT